MKKGQVYEGIIEKVAFPNKCHIQVDGKTVVVKNGVPDTDGDAVYVKKGSRAVLTPVETGEQSDGRTEIVSGLEEGEEVITNPYDVDISDGKRVK